MSIKFIKNVLANDESSTDAELIAYFVNEGLPLATAQAWVAKRMTYLNATTQ